MKIVMVNNNVSFIIAICFLLALHSILSVSSDTSDESAARLPGRIIVKSLPLNCAISFRNEIINKTSDLLTLADVPEGSYAITFKIYDQVLEAEIKVKAGCALLVHADFDRGEVLAKPDVYTGKDGAPMVMIPEGEFLMGSSYDEPDETPAHTVYVDAFYMDVYEVTNELYGKFLDATGHKPPGYWRDPKSNALNQPVVGVTWDDANAYCQWASKRLPTEAEWEKAARGGLVGKRYPWGDEAPAVDPTVDANPGVTGAYPVGSFAPNNYGLYDMARNAWEWCSDWYSEDYYARSPERNPRGPDSGDTRVLRGGSWFSGIATPLPVAYRYSLDPKRTSKLIGFRCVADVTHTGK